MTDDLRDEHRDPELEPVWAEWQAPAPSSGFHARVLHEFNAEFGRTPWWKTRWAVAAALVVAGAVMGLVLLRPESSPRYEPASQPRFMIVSAGEHP